MESTPSPSNHTPVPDELSQHLSWSRSNLTVSQWLLWYEQRRPQPYVLSPLSLAFTFFDRLDTRYFRQAFQSVADRSDSLRTVFVEEDGLPRRYVLPRLSMAMDIVDLSATSQPAVVCEQWLTERDLRPLSPALRPFDSTLVRLGEQHFVWRLALHRLIGDSRSLLLIYQYTAEAYAAVAAGTSDALRPLSAFEDYVSYDRKRVNNAALLEPWSSLRSHVHVSQPLPVPGDHYPFDLGTERTGALRRAASELAGDGIEGSSALFLLFATSLAILLVRLRGCQSVCIDTDLDMRPPGTWQDTIGRISSPHTLSVEVAEDELLPGLLSRLGVELERVRQQVRLAPITERSAAACRALLQVDDTTFPPFSGSAVKVDRLGACCSGRQVREQWETKVEPDICLHIDSYANRDNFKAVFTFCSGHVPHVQGSELAQEYLRLLDAL
jgi:hypothetical protein